jgi:Protein of unknown function (DUF4232)
MAPRARIAGTVLAALTIASMTAGCADRSTNGGSAAPPASGPATTAPGTTEPPPDTTTYAPTGTATRPAQAGPGRCHTADLAAGLRGLDSAAGNRYAAIVLTNRSSRTCRIHGYGGIGLLDANRRPVPTRQVREPAPPPQLITLAPGASAYSRLHWGAVPATGDNQTGPCQPQARYLLVTPPDETRSITVSWPFDLVCQRGRIDQTAYAAGTGPAS